MRENVDLWKNTIKDWGAKKIAQMYEKGVSSGQTILDEEIAKVNKEIGNKEVLPNVERLKKNTNAKVEGTDLKTNQIKNENLYLFFN